MTINVSPTSTEFKIARLSRELDIEVSVSDGEYLIEGYGDLPFSADGTLRLLQHVKAKRWARTGRTNA